MKTINNINYIRISKLAKDLQISKVTLYNWRRSGYITFYQPENLKINYVTEEVYNKLMKSKELKDSIKNI